VSNAQRCIGKDVSNGGIFQRARHGITILSIMITWALENAIETSDSMRSRGYGLPNRTAFSIYKFEKRDKTALAAIVLLGSYLFWGSILGTFKWRYFPTMKGVSLNLFNISLFVSYAVLCLVPVIITIKEEKQWKATQLKI